MLLRVLIGVDSELLEDIRVEEKAEYLVGRLDIDVTGQVMNTASEWLLNMHGLVGR